MEELVANAISHLFIGLKRSEKRNMELAFLSCTADLQVEAFCLHIQSSEQKPQLLSFEVVSGFQDQRFP